MTRAERDQAIAAAFQRGEKREYLAALYGLTPRRISQIAASYGLHRYHPDQVALGLHNRGGRPRDPRLAKLTGEQARFYSYLRRGFGAAYAREALGVAA